VLAHPRVRLDGVARVLRVETGLESAAHLVADLVSVRSIGNGLGNVDDWELLLALCDERQWDGLITCDGAMLVEPKELVVFAQKNLTLVITEAAGHNPIKAVGTLLCHLAQVCHGTNRERAQVWRPKVSHVGERLRSPESERAE
jgi:hypothetical protein